MEFLKGSIFDRDFTQTKVSTNRITRKEKLLGHIIGPGFVFMYYNVLVSLRELFYTHIMDFNGIFGNTYAYLTMTTVTTIIGIITGLCVTYVTERTVCRGGRFRPYMLIGEWLMVISGFFMFWSPFKWGSNAHLIWLYGFNILYSCIALPLYNLKDNMVSVCSRNLLERNNVTTLRSAIPTMISGVFGALLITGFLYPMILQNDYSGVSWYITIAITGALAFIFSFVEFFWIRERVTEDNQKVLADENGTGVIKTPLKEQFRNIITNKYYLLGMVVSFGMVFYSSLQGGNSRVDMMQYILGANDKNGLAMLYLIVSMQPMAIGAIVVPMIAAKVSSRKILMVSAVITLIGVAIAMINPYNFGIAVAGGMVFACGIFAVTNMCGVFGQQAADDIEYKHGYRVEGTLAAGIIGTLMTAVLSPLNAIYETGLSRFGFDASLAVQNEACSKWILFAYYGSYAVFALIILIVSIFFDLEKNIDHIHETLRQRAKKATEDRGEVYVSPEEQDRQEMEAAAKELEENRIAELKEKCAKKGLDFETENRKYLDKLAEKKAKQEAKAARKAAEKKKL